MELLDIYDDDGNKTGRVIERGNKKEVLSEHEHIAVAIIFIENKNHEFLIQKTSPEKGGEFSSTGGHINHNETPLETIIREVKEELGVDIIQEDIQEFGFIKDKVPLRYLFYTKKDIDIEKVQLQKEEVEYVEYKTIDEINNLIETNQMLPSHGMLFKELLRKIKIHN